MNKVSKNINDIFKAGFKYFFDYYYTSTIEKVFWSIFITEGIWLINWTLGREALNEQAINAIASKTFYYLGWVAIIHLNLFIIARLVDTAKSFIRNIKNTFPK